jgi:hypothetical protein
VALDQLIEHSLVPALKPSDQRFIGHLASMSHPGWVPGDRHRMGLCPSHEAEFDFFFCPFSLDRLKFQGEH